MKSKLINHKSKISLISAAALAKKFLPRPQPKPEYLTRAELHAGLDKTRDRIAASFLALGDKMDQQHTQILTRLDRQGDRFEQRFDQLETNLARVDERTRTPAPINPSIH
jgi:hypothetical protein